MLHAHGLKVALHGERRGRVVSLPSYPWQRERYWLDAPRGGLGHWVRIANGKITKYQCVVPSTWSIVQTGDYNGDGKADVAWRNASTGADAIWNGGNSATQITLIGVADTNWTLPEQTNSWVNTSGNYVV